MAGKLERPYAYRYIYAPYTQKKCLDPVKLKSMNGPRRKNGAWIFSKWKIGSP
jgi:hypothetical protein